jgi:hypothetical protein
MRPNRAKMRETARGTSSASGCDVRTFAEPPFVLRIPFIPVLAISALVAGAGCTASPTISLPDGNNHAVAVGGTTYLTLGPWTGASAASATSSDPSVLSVVSVDPASKAAEDGQVEVVGQKEGTAVITALDSDNKAIAQATIRVAPAASVTLDWPTGIATLPYPDLETIATAFDGSGLSLEGATFSATAQGSLITTTVESGDIEFATVGLGDGALTVSSGSASTTTTIQVVPASEVDLLAFKESSVTLTPKTGANVAYVLSAVGARVFTAPAGLTCASSNSSVATASAERLPGEVMDANGWDPIKGGGMLFVVAESAGMATVTCGYGGAEASLEVTVK